jgi:hypothetical protein
MGKRYGVRGEESAGSAACVIDWPVQKAKYLLGLMHRNS